MQHGLSRVSPTCIPGHLSRPVESGSRTTEKQNIAVRVSELEAAQSLPRVLEGCAENRAAIDKFGGKSIRVWRKDKSIPPHGWMTLGIWQRWYVPLRLQEYLRPIAANDGEERISIWLLKCNLESKLLAIERDGSTDVADDEERRNRRSRCSSHERFPSLYLDPHLVCRPSKKNEITIRILHDECARSPWLLPQYLVEGYVGALICKEELLDLLRTAQRD